MKSFVLSLVLVFVVAAVHSQTEISFSPASNGMTFNTCNGFIIDSGGQGGPGYSNNEFSTITICPDTPGEIISVVFNLFDLDGTNTGTQQNPNVDYMAVYDGTNTGANSLGVYNTNGLQGVVIQATELNPSGCITLTFYSNGSGTGMFTASVSCETPCSNPVAGGVIVDGITEDSIRVCVNQLVEFQEQGSFAQPGFSLVDYSWDFMDGTTANGQNVSHSWSIPGLYRVQLFVTDDNGCSNPNLIDLQVLVGTIPDFTGFPGDETICLGESATFSADPETYEVLWDGFPGSQTVDDGCLPDTLLGVSQDIELMQTGFSAGSTINSVNDIQSICLDLEHSFMGDLVIMLECPSGQSVIMHQQGGGGTQIGIPVQADNVDCSDPATMGTPFTYCFTPTATTTWVEWVNANGGGTIPAGDYESVQPLSNLVGCPANGVWTLTVIDNWAADDGTLFSFGLNLDPSFYPDISTFQPQIGVQCDSSYWVSPQYQSSISPDCNELTVTPTDAGSFIYTYSVTDDFGCSFDTTLVLTVEDLAEVFAGNDTTLCDGATLQLDAQVIGAQTSCTYTLVLDDTFGDGWNGNTLTITENGNSSSYTLSTGSSTSYQITVPSGSSVSVTFNANGSWVNECEYTIIDDEGNVILNQGPGLSAVTNDVFTANCSPEYVYSWTPTNAVSDPTITDPMFTGSGQQTLTFSIYPTGHPLCASSDNIVVTVSVTPDAGIDNQAEVCSSGTSVDLSQFLDPNAWPNGTWFDPNGVEVVMPLNPSTMTYGDYSYFVDNDGCTDEAIISITELFTSITNISTVNPTCFGFANGSATVEGVNIASYSLNGGAPVMASSPFTLSGLTAGNYDLQVFSADGCTDNQSFVLTEPEVLTAAINEVQASCFGICDGSVTVTPNGGTQPYSYSWNGLNGDQSGNASQICAGSYAVTVTDAQACSVDLPFVINEPDNVIPTIVGDVLAGCDPHTVNFVNTTNSGNILTTFVDFGDGTTALINGEEPFTHEYTTPGLYSLSVILTTNDNCVYSASYDDLVTVYSQPIADFIINPNSVSMFEPVVNLIDQSEGIVSIWNWTIHGGSPANSTNQHVDNVSYPVDVPAIYSVELYVENEFGCFDSIVKTVSVENDILLFAPNTFTPDDDEFNQTWNIHISGIDIYDFELLIFNRWGELIWESHDPNVGWDGTYKGQIVQQGTYSWVMNVADGYNDDRHTFEGHVNIIK